MAESRDRRITSKVPEEPKTMTQLLVWTKNQMRLIAAEGVEVEKLIKITGKHKGERALLCGDRNSTWFARSDGLTCNFAIAVRENDDHLELLSYVLHLECTAPTMAGPKFLRFEYSPSRKDGVSAVKEPLAHMHPGHDHVRIPSPVFSPSELITLFTSLHLWR